MRYPCGIVVLCGIVDGKRARFTLGNELGQY